MIDWQKAEDERWRVLHTNAIESNSAHVKNHASQIAHHVRMLANLPAYETMAEDELNKAIAVLTEATLIAKVARSDLQKKRKSNLRLVARG